VISLLLLTVLACAALDPCPPVTTLPIEDPDGLVSADSLTSIQRTLDGFLAQAGAPGICVSQVNLVTEDQVADPSGAMADWKGPGGPIDLAIVSDSYSADALAHGLCHALDDAAGHPALQAAADVATASLPVCEGCGDDDIQRYAEAFATSCGTDLGDGPWLRVAWDQACPEEADPWSPIVASVASVDDAWDRPLSGVGEWLDLGSRTLELPKQDQGRWGSIFPITLGAGEDLVAINVFDPGQNEAALLLVDLDAWTASIQSLPVQGKWGKSLALLNGSAGPVLLFLGRDGTRAWQIQSDGELAEIEAPPLDSPARVTGSVTDAGGDGSVWALAFKDLAEPGKQITKGKLITWRSGQDTVTVDHPFSALSSAHPPRAWIVDGSTQVALSTSKFDSSTGYQLYRHDGQHWIWLANLPRSWSVWTIGPRPGGGWWATVNLQGIHTIGGLATLLGDASGRDWSLAQSCELGWSWLDGSRLLLHGDQMVQIEWFGRSPVIEFHTYSAARQDLPR